MKLYKKNKNYCIDNPGLSVANEMYLENGGSLEVSFKLVDKRNMTEQQRKFIFALCGIVEYETGIESEYFRATVMTIFNNIHNEKYDSITQYSMTDANKLIDLIITTMIEKEIPLDGDLLKKNEFNFNSNHTYLMCFKRMCVVCGRRADLHHVDTVGMGRDRKKISHIGLRMLPLCRKHHNETHTIGDKHFIERYHLEPIVIDKKLEYFIKTGKIKVIE